MSVVVVGCGRSGTNIALEMLSGSPSLKASHHVEDKEVFTRGDCQYKDNYLTKCDTVYFTFQNLLTTFGYNPDMKVVWTWRDPRDMLMSKIYRGRPNTEGRGNHTASDGTIEGAIQDMQEAYVKFDRAKGKFKSRIMRLYMEDIILLTRGYADLICSCYDLKFSEDMLNFPSRMRNEHKKKRYGNKRDYGQIALHDRKDEVYDGYFKDWFSNGWPEPVMDLCRRLGYE